MARTTSVALDDHAADFIGEQIESGRFASESEAVNAGLRLLEDHEAKLKALRAAIDEGEQSGWVENFDIDTFLEEMNKTRNA
ncbi:MAG TPA: type II toxin-antitoxin system ParD family antitoxin [Asticcacaulis sp.]|nr:type II toxin-antitoxin system ParD family antitoxin [Asticcacaulis sp.]